MAVDQAAYEAAKTKKTTKSETKSNSSSNSDVLIDIDLTADYESGREIIDARLKAVGAGMRDRLAEVKGAFKDFTCGTFVIAEATYSRPALPASEEETKSSVIGLLFPASEYEQVEEITNG